LQSLRCADRLKFNCTLDLLTTSFPEVQLLHLYKLREGRGDRNSFNKWGMLPIWDRYHVQSYRPLMEMTLQLQNLAHPWRYNQIYRLWRVPTRTYHVSRCADEGLTGRSIVKPTMLEFEQTTRESLEKTPQQPKADFSNFCRRLERLCNEGQVLNTCVAGLCGR
jgi:hypothetical protein